MCGHNPKIHCQPNNDVFAAYFRETDQFQLFQLDKDEFGKYARIKNYAQPDLSKWNMMKASDKKRLEPWKAGQEWYLVPNETTMSNKSDLKVNQITIHNQTYYWWQLNCNLVWSNYQMFTRRSSSSSNSWTTCPLVPVLEFNSKLIYPRTEARFYARCPILSTNELFKESERGRSKVQEMMGLLAGSPKEKEQETIPERPVLSIRTPRVEEEHLLSDTDAENEGRAHGRIRLDSNGYIIDQFDDNYMIFSRCLVIFMILMAIGVYGFSIARVLGY
jgi:hypothetical protein